ncbi:MAG: hypothetical protein IID33_10655, partial [Planctomycetes bacterium]|nr:hypothetical protein [Planctomycetota bacterium]
AGGEIPIDDEVREREVVAVEKDERVLGELADYLGESAAERTSQAREQKEDVLGVEGVQSTGPDIFEPIMVESFPQSDVELSDQLEAALGVWLKDIPTAVVLGLPALANVDRAARVIVDETGRLWVICGSLQEPASLLCRALAARKWAVDHLSLIKGSFSQVKIDPAFSIGLILVSGGDLEPLRDGCSQLEGIDYQTLRLTFLQKGEQRSIVVI